MPTLAHSLSGRLAVAALLGTLTVPAAGQAVNADRAGLALYGYDPVAYHTEGQAVRGLPDLSLSHGDLTYRFATTANREAFQVDPARYLPAYGGYCAYGVASGYKVKVDPEAFTIVGGMLYLNYSKSVQRRWLKDTTGYIATADLNWGQLRDAPRKD
jgi:hypothetical protein